MKTLHVKLLTVLVFLGLTSALLSFTFAPGAENYVIHVNNKKVVDQYVSRNTKLPTVSLNSSIANTKMTVFYNHCGKIGTNRSLGLYKGDQKINEWKFNNNSGKEMHIDVKEILNHLNTDTKALHLVYASNEIQKGISLAKIESNSPITAN